MKEANITIVNEFILVGLSDLPEVRYFLFVMFLIIYLATLAGNITILIAIQTDICLHNPMYYFLSHLSLLDILSPTITVPKMLNVLLSENKNISFTGCMVQLFFLIDLVSTEVFLLSVMAYDRYVAICHPLKYTNIMNRRVCGQLAFGTWIAGFFNSLLHTSFTFTLSFCGPNEVNQYYCDIPPVQALSCSSTYASETIHMIVTGVGGGSAFVITLISYIYIIWAIVHMRSPEGRQKAFSTCAAHLTVVCLFYGTSIFTYIKPSSSYSPNRDRIVSMLYGVVTPMLNPMIYSLRNKGMKQALKRVISQKRFILQS
ncbi:olfactory receptor 5V1-like [Alligator sinensis]|uniref:Olfactory receptor n=1 Tax=Alligator sinensis TaxID=38654 RepID=A0A1U7S7E2_ALLSI|nr:olfactory receptor 5V1-like [Alligator sinensis]